MSKTSITTITNLTHDGRGISGEGKKIFIDGALPQEKVEFTFLKQRSQYDEGKISQVLIPSPYRQQPDCAHFGICGGCSLQHLHTSQQLMHKQNVFLEQLQHFAKLSPQHLLSPITGPIWGYRRKARLGVKFIAKKQEIIVGFREKNSRFLADIHHCKVLEPKVGTLFPVLKNFISQLSIAKLIPQIEIACSLEKTALVFRHLAPLSAQDERLFVEFGQQHNVHIYLQPQGLDSIHLFWPPEESAYLTYKLPTYNLEFLFLPTDFTQVNWDINPLMVDQALELLKVEPEDRILDLFCGIGNFTLPLARTAQHVVGVEGNGAAIERAKYNQQHNQLKNVDFYQADLQSEHLQGPWLTEQYNKIILDPPRSGALNVLKYIDKLQPKRVVYISCNPATFARDAGELVHRWGFRLQAAGIMDMFPHTTHVEVMALFERD